MPNLTDQFIEELYSLSSSQYPDKIKHQAKRCLLDYIGVTFAGAKTLKAKGEHLLNFLGVLSGNATVIGHGRKTSIQSAAFLNGLNAHVAELDDGVNAGIIHPGSPVISAILPMAEIKDVNGEDLISGMITGYEATTRLACAIQPDHKKLGYHASGTCGTVGAAIGIAAMLNFTRSEMKEAFSSATVSASGTLKVIEDESELKPFNIGRAALIGCMAASVAKAGFKGPNDSLSGDAGFLSVMTERYDTEQLNGTNAGRLAIDKIYVKPFAACRYCHPAIDAALSIKRSNSIKFEDIKLVKVYTYYWAVKNHDHSIINSTSSAKMSIPYSVAVALLTGKADLSSFSLDTVNDHEVKTLTEKVKVHIDNDLTKLFPKKCSAVVEVVTKDGESYKERVDLPKGEPENPLSDAEIEDKFIALSMYGGKTNKECKEIIDVVWNLDSRLNKLYQLIQ